MPPGDLDATYWSRGLVIVGVDEVGRGPLAGPVVAAAVTLNPLDYPDGLDDSKKLIPEKRERLDAQIRASALAFSIISAGSAEIDALDIRKATLICMAKAVQEVATHLERQNLWVLVDGKDRILLDDHLDIVGQDAIVKGDALSLSVAAASIIAKVHRDNLMREYAKQYPAYGLETHFGYGTPAHLQALKEHGPCPIHRRSFIQRLEENRSQISLFD